MGKNIICNIFWKKEEKKKRIIKNNIEIFFFTIFTKNIQIKHES